ncbi:MAG: ArsR family transcriptional regulator [Nonomuraea muscovyensis]|nr:ArsR family transcriptional regulator [Nonomuraea muscovyensis]
MAVRLLLDRRQPASIQLKVSPIVAALTGMRFADSPRIFPLASGESATHRSSLVHITLRRPSGVARLGCARRLKRQRPAPPRPHQHHGRVPRPDDVPLSPPLWDRLRDLLEADLRHRMRRLAEGGLVDFFADLHPWVHFDGEILRVDTRCDAEPSACTNGLILMPTLLSNRVVLLAAEPPKPAVLLYPTRGAAGWASLDHLHRLVGNCRLSLLEDLRQPRTADELANRHHMDPQSTRRHLTTLPSAGLLSMQCRPAEQYECTHVASALVAPQCASCS